MATYKCKMCGGTIELEKGTTVGVCNYCGTKQTLPWLDDDRRANLYDRANHFRRNDEFDKAAGIYERILNEDPTDAEAYWSLVLCRYGIEYVEDPATHKRVPTVNRAQFTSVFDDDNYQSALQYADALQRALYEQEASAINEIQKSILAISQKEEPFDVFICYKETDANGRRTPDSVLANDLYHQLTREGFKAFFSRITLEDKLGQEYEPYIFAALNSAKVMVVLGTKPEYFNAAWVKNEWSRYLTIVKQSGGKKILIPAFRDMDPYDLPEEFSHLQAQDMSKLGFMQDLIHGIKKIVGEDAPKPEPKKTPEVVPVSANAAPLLRRAFIFLEDGDWNKADEFCEQVLNLEPENAQAYLGKLMAELHVYQPDELRDCKQPFDNSNNYRKAIRFGDAALAESLQANIAYINERNENARLTALYNTAMDAKYKADTEARYKAAAEMFESISGFKDADALCKECAEKAEDCRKDLIYRTAKAQMMDKTIASYESAIQKFLTVSGWKDADEQVVVCENKIDEIKEKEEADHLEQERQKEQRRINAEKVMKKRKKIATIVSCIMLACIVFIIVLTIVIIPTAKYNAAISLYNMGKYDEAITAFTSIYEYKDSSERIKKCNQAIKDDKYRLAVDLIEKGDYINAYEALVALNGYKDSADKAIEIYSKYKTTKIKVASVGDIVYFGSYEQDNNLSNGKEDIEWVVLAKKDNKELLISKHALDCQPYNTSRTIITWETCSLRKWLNGMFLDNAFSLEEQNSIISSTVTADKNPSYDTSPGNNTKDKVFLLSITEYYKFFDSFNYARCQGTAYCYLQGTRKDYDGNCWWWVRTPGNGSSIAATVNGEGSIDYSGFNVDYLGNAIRPAIWISLG